MQLTSEDKMLLVKIITLFSAKPAAEKEYVISIIMDSETVEEMKFNLSIR